MEILDYKPNSYKSKEEQGAKNEPQRAEKVVNGTVKVKKKSKFGRDFNDVKDYAVKEVIVPGFKEILFSVLKEGAERLIFGDSGSRRDRKRSTAEKVSYRDYYGRGDDRRETSRARTRFDYDDLIFPDYGEADAVLDRMGEMIRKYHFVTVGDMYDMADITAPHTSYNYGWDDISSADIRRAPGGGYIIDLPRAIPRDR